MPPPGDSGKRRPLDAATAPGASGAAPTRLLVPADVAGTRIDAWLADVLPDLSRSRAARLMADGHVRVNGAGVRKSYPLETGDRIEVQLPAPVPTHVAAEAIPLHFVYQDEHLAVVDKPAGLVVHPAPGNRTGTLVHALLHHLDDLSGVGGVLRPGIVHRLDRDTSGLLVVAKSDAAHRGLAAALKRREVQRLYLAAAWGHVEGETLRVDAPIARSPRHRKRMAVVEGGRAARTHLRVLERWRGADLIEARLETGRTHQIRVHLAHLGHPVVGDPVYGGGGARRLSGIMRPWARALERRVPRQFLHAARLSFTHPVTGEPLCFDAPLPEVLAAAAEWARESSAPRTSS